MISSTIKTQDDSEDGIKTIDCMGHELQTMHENRCGHKCKIAIYQYLIAIGSRATKFIIHNDPHRLIFFVEYNIVIGPGYPGGGTRPNKDLFYDQGWSSFVISLLINKKYIYMTKTKEDSFLEDILIGIFFYHQMFPSFRYIIVNSYRMACRFHGLLVFENSPVFM